MKKKGRNNKDLQGGRDVKGRNGALGSVLGIWIRIQIHYSEVWIRILPFSYKCVEQTEQMLDKIEF